MATQQQYTPPVDYGMDVAVPRRQRYNPAGTPNPNTAQFIPPTAEPMAPEDINTGGPPPNQVQTAPPLPMSMPSAAANLTTPSGQQVPAWWTGLSGTNFGGGNAAQQWQQIEDTFGTAAPAGFDASKWADQSHLSDKYLIGHILAASGGIDDVVSALNQRTPGWKKTGQDTISAPDGSEFDILYDVGGPDQRPQMLQTKGPGGVPLPPGGGAAGAGAGGAGGTGLPGSGGSGNALDAILQDFLAHGGLSPTGEAMWGKLMDTIDTGGLDLPALSSRLNAARGDAAGQFQGLTADARDQLASRGMATQPGVEQGGEHDAIGRITDSVGRNLSTTVSGIENNAFDQANANVMGALSAATGLSEDAAHNILNAIGKGTDRDQLFADVALRQLSLNEDWNKFLAGYGLDRDKLEYEISHGDTQQLIDLLNAFMGIANQAGQGHY